MNEWSRWFLEPSLRACLLAASIGLILVVGRVRQGRARHLAWTAVLAAMSLMPLLPRWVPDVKVTMPVGLPLEMPLESPPLSRSSNMPSSTVAEPLETREWPDPVVPIYLLGVVFLLARVGYGWWAAHRMQMTLIDGMPAFESPQVKAPLTAGVFRAKVILPLDWRTWSSTKLRAVLAHERAHVRRRDPLIGLIATLNRCIFWFHPLAWWLERQLAMEAEFACDEAAIQEAGDRRRYAGFLVEIADSVRRAGGRVAWQGIGADGTGTVGKRIDRILSGAPGNMSRRRQAFVGGACCLAVFLAAACTQKWQPPADALKFTPHDEEFRQSLSRSRKWQQRTDAVAKMTPEQAAALEAALKTNPGDLETRQTLLLYYSNKGGATPETTLARRAHVLWLIENRPGEEDSVQFLGRTASDPLADPAGYEQAAKLWRAQAARQDANPKVLTNAGGFFSLSDPETAEGFYQRAASFGNLGRLYVSMMDWRSRPDLQAKGRKKLEESREPRVLSAAAQWLVLRPSRNPESDSIAFGNMLLERAEKLDPNSVDVRRVRQNVNLRAQFSALPAELQKARTPEEKYAVVSRLPGAQRVEQLSMLAVTTYMLGENTSYYQHDAALAHAQWQLAGRYAQEALDLASKVSGSPDYGTIVYRSNMTLGLSSMREGKRRAAVRYLVAASKAPKSDALAYSFQPLGFRLPKELVKAGERDAVVEYLERFAQTNVSDRDRLLESAHLLRQGRTPYWVEF